MPITYTHEELRVDIEKLWTALGRDEPFFDSQGKDVYTLAVEAIEERDALKVQIHDLEYRLEAQKETNREICAIEDVGRVVHDLEVANGHIAYYRNYTQDLLKERATLRRALVMIKRIAGLTATPWFSPCKLIDKLVIGVFNGEFND